MLVEALQQRVSMHRKARKVKIIPENWIKVVETNRLSFDASTFVPLHSWIRLGFHKFRYRP